MNNNFIYIIGKDLALNHINAKETNRAVKYLNTY